MRRVVQVITTLLPAALLAACASPTAPAQASCDTGKVPYASCENKADRDYINPLADYINPLADYINPLANVSAKSGE